MKNCDWFSSVEEEERYFDEMVVHGDFIPSEFPSEGETERFLTLEELKRAYPINIIYKDFIKSEKTYSKYNKYIYKFKTSECIKYIYDGTSWYGIIKYTYYNKNEKGIYAEYWYKHLSCNKELT